MNINLTDSSSLEMISISLSDLPPPSSSKTPLIKKKETNPTVVKTSDLWKMVISQSKFPFAIVSGTTFGLAGLSIYYFSTDALLAGTVCGAFSIISPAPLIATYYKLVSALKKEEHPEQVKINISVIWV